MASAGRTRSKTATSSRGAEAARRPAGPLARSRSFRASGRGAALAALLAVILAAGFHLLFGDMHLNLADEGFLWYGAERTAAGEVPLRDFQAYDPGRYYWSAAWFRAFGDGILSLRASAAAFQAVGLFFALLVVRRAGGLALQLGAGLVLLAWMFPPYKHFDSAPPMVAVYGLLRVLEEPSRKTFFLYGLIVGLLAFVGRHHGVYAGLAFAGLVALLFFRRRETRPLGQLPAFAAGLFAGLLPLLAMLAFPGGFAAAFVESVRAMFAGWSSFGRDVEWPWRVGYAGAGWYRGLGLFSASSCFLLMPIVYTLGAVAALSGDPHRLEKKAVLIASSLAGAAYLDYAYGRADWEHLAFGISPLLLGVVGIPAAFGFPERRLALAVWCPAGLFVLLGAFAVNPALENSPLGPRPLALTRYRVGGDQLRLLPNVAGYVGRVERVVTRHVRPEERLFVAPNFTTFYPLLGKTSPVWMISFLGRSDEARQRATVRSLEEGRVEWALVVKIPAAGLRFRDSNPLVWRYLNEAYELVPDPELPRAHDLFRRRAAE